MAKPPLQTQAPRAVQDRADTRPMQNRAHPVVASADAGGAAATTRPDRATTAGGAPATTRPDHAAAHGHRVRHAVPDRTTRTPFPTITTRRHL